MAKTKEKDLYEILGVGEKASADEIKKAYRGLAKKYHPDRTGGDKSKETRFKEASAAYEVLSDPRRREQYDLMRRGGFQGGPGGMPDFSAFEGIDGIEDLLGGIFGGAFRNAAGGAGRSGRVVVESRPFSGGGASFGGFEDLFGGLRGGGQAQQQRPAPPPAETTVRTADGVELVRKGDDLHGEVEIGIDEAVLGGKVPVSTMDGRLTLTIPPGTSSGKKLRLRGRGVLGRGDHYVTVKIVVPDKVDGRAEELIREFAVRAPARLRR